MNTKAALLPCEGAAWHELGVQVQVIFNSVKALYKAHETCSTQEWLAERGIEIVEQGIQKILRDQQRQHPVVRDIWDTHQDCQDCLFWSKYPLNIGHLSISMPFFHSLLGSNFLILG
jgi:hypothetical protein